MSATKPEPGVSIASRIVRTIASVARSLAGSISSGISRTYLTGENWIVGAKHAVYGLAIGRILIGFMVVGMAISNFSTRLYSFGPGVAWSGQLAYPTSSFATIWPFSMVTHGATDDVSVTVMFLALIACGVLFGIGYHTKLVMIPLFILWVGLLNIDLYVQDQSDNLTRMVMVVLFFTAPAEKWSLDAWRRKKYARTEGSIALRWWRFQPVAPAWWSNTFHNFGIVVIGAQLCMIYASGGLFKAGGLPWQNGTAIYAPIHTQQFGTWPILSDLMTTWGPMVALGTVGTVLVQVSFPLLLLRRGTRIFGLIVILGFHIAIAVLMGLPWFSLSMVALDAIFVRDVTWSGFYDKIVGAWRSTRAGKTPLIVRLPEPPAPGEVPALTESNV